MTVIIDKERDNSLQDVSLDLLHKYYLREGETPQEGFARAAEAFSFGDDKLAQAIYEDVSKGWAMFSSPILSNAPRAGEKPKAMPISCFLAYVPDTREGIVDHQSEIAWLSMLGGGVGGHWSDVRAVSDKSVGPIPHIKIADSAMEGFRQGRTRKGSYAAYLDISHPDVLEFIQMRTPTGGDINRKCFNIHHAVNITDEFMEAVYNGDLWTFKCPHSGRPIDSIDARELFQLILETRFRTGEPYINFIDTANKHLPEAQKRLGLEIHGSNLCNEIHLPTDAQRTAVCCLSSVNLEKWDEWKDDPGFIRRWVRFLDNVLEFFIKHAPSVQHKAVFSAQRERAIGLGAMGWHYLLQKKNIPFESALAVSLNKKIFAHIKEQAEAETFDLAKERGEAPDMEGTGRRNSHLLAIAPNANSGLICGTSPSIEPLRSNAYTTRTRAGTHLFKNKYLEEVLAKYGKNDDATWLSIIHNSGSVQHLDFLPQWEKDVFKTATEIDQTWVVQHAADRQEFICQGQSVNLYFPYGADKNYVKDVHLLAHKKQLKGLYYLRTSAGFSGDKVGAKIERVALRDGEECVACQG